VYGKEVINTRVGIVPFTVCFFADGGVAYGVNNLQALIEPVRYRKLLTAISHGQAEAMQVKDGLYVRGTDLERATGLSLYYDRKVNRITAKRGYSRSFNGIPVWTTSFEPQVIASAGQRGDWKMDRWDMGAALPSREFLGRKVLVHYPKTGKTVVVPVIDVGPWNTKDEWILKGRRPAAEQGMDQRGRNTNLAGLDLSYPVWVELGVEYERAYSGRFSAMVEFILLD
jgi:hypothetical protein